MTTKHALRAIALVGSSLMIGCAWNPWSSSPALPSAGEGRALKVTPHARIQDGADSADAFHALGRHLQREGRLDDAERAYRRALDFDPGHQKTRNALAVLHASRGDLAQAIKMLAALVAESPDQPHLLANLGYAHYLNGDYPAAKERLKQALAIDPDSEATRHKLSLVMTKLGESGDGQDDVQQVQALPVPVPPSGDEATVPNGVIRVSDSVYALTHMMPVSPAAAPARVPTVQCETPPADAPLKSAQAVSGAANAVADVTASATATATASATPRLRIELANGNGINRLARSVRDLIAGSQWQVVRVINHEDFTVPVTRIEYARHRYESARELAQTLGVAAQLRPNYQQGDTQLRVVFGRDFRSAEGLRERLVESGTPALASAHVQE